MAAASLNNRDKWTVCPVSEGSLRKVGLKNVAMNETVRNLEGTDYDIWLSKGSDVKHKKQQIHRHQNRSPK